MGRPKANIDWVKVGAMLEAGAFATGIAASFGIDEDTLRRRAQVDLNIGFTEFRQQKIAKGDDSLRVAQYKTALEGSVPMQIWLGKNRLGQSDKHEITTDPKIADLKTKIQARAQEKGIPYEQELENWKEHYSDGVAPEVKQKLLTETVQ